MKSSLQAVLNRSDIWSGNELARAEDSIASGFPEFDALLPGGGWPHGALTEVIVEREGIGELRLLLPALSRLTHDDQFIACVAPPYLPYAPALARAGVKLSHFLLVRAQSLQDQLWAAEQTLRSAACAAVLFWLNKASDLRRLQLAAEEGRGAGIVFRRSGQQSSYAALRLALSPARDLTRIDILKRRGGQAAPLFLNLNVDLPLLSHSSPASFCSGLRTTSRGQRLG